ncbi:MAG: cytochrome c [Melioribacteraceae bacterium]|nr:cytochrome c [Melioribacteraceae bacterium]MCF8264004.1 cytochrome c [Melioribacteraceae bacterium]MCF8412574.1 cytochrome c [Melioribacteraceae bacterium]MCF8431041.1 cytochrome c [Melioribacteraceae bacterium]
MTNAQKWITAALLLFLILFFLQKFTETDEIDLDDMEYYQSDSEMQPKELDGLALMKNIGCLNCHGGDLKGGKLAPSLYSANELFDRSELINYLRNPASYSNDKRFEEYKKKYTNIVMPSYNNIDVKNLGIIADYLLALEEE